MNRAPSTSFYRDHQRSVLGTVSLTVFIAGWQILLGYVWPANPLFLTVPSAIARAFYALMISGELATHLYVSMYEFVIGLGLAVMVGIPLGLGMGLFRRLEYLLDPFMTALYASPIVALAPLLILFFGVGPLPKILLVLFLAFFPILYNTFTGVRIIDPLLIDVVRSFGAKRRQLTYKVILPAAIPLILTGIRLAIGRGLIGVIVGEFIAATEGVGYLIATAGGTYRIDELFVGILVIGFIAVGCTEVVRRIENRVAPWRVELEAAERR